MIAIRGAGSAIVQALRPLLPADEMVVEVSRHAQMPADSNRHLFAAGVLYPKQIGDQDAAEIAESFFVNAAWVMQDCDRLIAANDHVRICVIGSESGFAGSFDGSYAASKAALHRYVETKRLRTPDQQLICIAPTIIRDAGMTLRRADLRSVDARAAEHPKRRWLAAIEVARLIRFCLYEDQGYLSGTVIRMNGGASTACR